MKSKQTKRKNKAQQTKLQSAVSAVKDFFGGFRLGIDFWAIIPVVLLFVPNVIWWSWSPADDILRYASFPPALDVFAFIFEGITFAVLLFVLNRGTSGKRLSFESPFFTFTLMATILSLAAWVFYFCGQSNIAVLIFLAVFPCAALGCFAALRRNWIAFLPLVVFTALHVSWMICVIV